MVEIGRLIRHRSRLRCCHCRLKTLTRFLSIGCLGGLWIWEIRSLSPARHSRGGTRSFSVNKELNGRSSSQSRLMTRILSSAMRHWSVRWSMMMYDGHLNLLNSTAVMGVLTGSISNTCSPPNFLRFRTWPPWSTSTAWHRTAIGS